MMNFKMKNKTLFLCLPAMLNIPFGGSSVFRGKIRGKRQ